MGAQVHIFALGRHLGFSSCGGLGQGDIDTNPLLVKHRVTIQDGSIKPIYLAFPSEIMPALQAIVLTFLIQIITNHTELDITTAGVANG